MANDPSQNVHGDLLPHVHLLSTYRYPIMPRLELQEVTKWLLGAPKIARDTAPFFWTYLDSPQDGAIYLTWQPLSRRGTEFASDGYVWATQETYYRQEVGSGLVLEIFFQRCGYRFGESVAVHSRRRFRLMPPQAAVPNTPQVDPSLWIVHYGPAEKNDRLPVHMLPIHPPMQQALNFRQQLLSMGQIVRKEFILSDRVNWPQISLPGRGNSMYAPPVNVRGVPQTMAYPPQGVPPVGQTPKRRAGQVAPQTQGHQHPMVPSLDAAYDDEEDTSRGDPFDHLTPREVGIARYRQNHEWMEEILSSPYSIRQIIVPDLGLGLKGELSSLTEGIFEAQGSDALTDIPKKPYVGHLDPGLADEFRKRANEKIEATKAEIEKMKVEHVKAVTKLKNNSIIKDAEADLRSSVQGTGPEFWRLEGRQEEGEEGMVMSPHQTDKKIEDILARVEESLGKQASTVRDVHQVQAGGYQEPAPEPEPVLQVPQMAVGGEDTGVSEPMSRQPSQLESQDSGIMIGDSDIDMGGTAAGLLDQMHTGFESTPTPVNNFPTPQPHLSAIASSVATPVQINAPSPQPNQPLAAGQTITSVDAITGDASMEDVDGTKAEARTIPDQGTGSGDWVVVPKTDGSQGPPPNPIGASGTPQPQPATAEEPVKAQPQVSSKPVSAAPTPGDGSAFDADNNDFSSLGDLDTAGDALASYDGTGGDLTEGLDLNMDMDDSAFGDAFHGVEQSAAGTPADSGL